MPRCNRYQDPAAVLLNFLRTMSRSVKAAAVGLLGVLGAVVPCHGRTFPTNVSPPQNCRAHPFQSFHRPALNPQNEFLSLSRSLPLSRSSPRPLPIELRSLTDQEHFNLKFPVYSMWLLSVALHYRVIGSDVNRIPCTMRTMKTARTVLTQ